jgi:hypothetical protein
MDPFEIPQGLLGRDAVIPVRLHRVAKFGQRSLRGQNQMRPIDASLPAQKIRDRIGRERRGGVGRLRRPRGRKSGGGLRGRSVMLRRFWSGRGCRRPTGGREGRQQRSEKRRGTTLVLKKKRVDGDAGQTDRQARCEIETHVLGLRPPSQPLPQGFAGGMLKRSSERNRTGSDARKSQSQFYSP